MRIIKEANERRNEILDAAESLFAQKGFDGCSTGDILEKVGIARGTLYYHFKSKEDIMDALIARYNEAIVSRAQEAAARRDVPVLARILGVVSSFQIEGPQKGKDELMAHIHKPQNALMHQKIQYTLLKAITPILAELVREGNEQGVFHAAFPYECMEMTMVYALTVFDEEMEAADEETQARRVQALGFHIEKLLGAPEGSLSAHIAAMIAGKRGEENA